MCLGAPRRSRRGRWPRKPTFACERKARGLTLAALADQVGSKVSTLAGWETGERAVDLGDLRRLADFYGVEVAALIAPPGEDGDRARDLRLAAALAGRMDDETRREWLGIGRKLARASEGDPAADQERRTLQPPGGS